MKVAQTLRGGLKRPADLLARYGGEEFVALLPETDAAGAQIVAARLQGALKKMEPHAAVRGAITVSIGVTAWDSTAETTAEQMLEAADHALYQAKQNGRNRIEYHPLLALGQG